MLALSLALTSAESVSADERRLLRPEDEEAIRVLESPALTQDGALVAYLSNRELYVIPAAGGKRTRAVAEGQTSTQPAWSPTGEKLAFLSSGPADDAQVWLAPRDGGPAAALTKFAGEVLELAWSPDGKRLAVVVATTDDQDRQFTGTHIDLELQDVPLAAAFAIIARASGVAMRPDADIGGRITLRLTDTPWDQALSVILWMQGLAYRLDDTGPGMRIAPRERLHTGADDGKKVVQVDDSSAKKYSGHPISLDFVNENVRAVLSLFADISGLNVAVHPDVQGRQTLKVSDTPWDQVFDTVLKEQRLGYVLNGNVIRVASLSMLRDGRAASAPRVFRSQHLKREGHGYLAPETERHTRVHLVDVVNGESVAITSSAHSDSEPRWSPDGRQIIFTSNGPATGAPRDRHTLVIDAAPDATPTLVPCANGTPSSPVFRPDGTGIACIDDPDSFYQASRIRLVDLNGTVRDELLLDRPALDLRFSADGAWLYFIVEDSGRRSLIRMPSDGTRLPEPVVAGERHVASYDVAPSGTVAFVASEPAQPDELFVLARGHTHQLTDENSNLVKQLKLGPVQRLRAKSSDGTWVEAFLVLPPDGTGIRLPTILRLHGGPNSQYTSGFDFEWQILAAQGYAVLAPNPRGSIGYGTAFATAISGDWGQRDFDDVMAVVDEAIERGVADPQRLGVGGWSYGGYLTNVVVTRTKRFRAAVTGAGIANLMAMYGVDDTADRWIEEFGEPWKNVERWMRASPFFQVENVETPVLIICGEKDLRTPVSQSEQWFTALLRLGRTTELVLYPGEGHNFRSARSRQDRWRREIAWYDRYLKVAERPLVRDQRPAPNHGLDSAGSNK